MLCPHAFQMAMQPGTDILIEGTFQLSVGHVLSVGLCEGCAAVLADDLSKRKFRVTVVRPKPKRSNSKR